MWPPPPSPSRLCTVKRKVFGLPSWASVVDNSSARPPGATENVPDSEPSGSKSCALEASSQISRPPGPSRYCRKPMYAYRLEFDPYGVLKTTTKVMTPERFVVTVTFVMSGAVPLSPAGSLTTIGGGGFGGGAAAITARRLRQARL